MTDLTRLPLADMRPDLQAYLKPRVARLKYLGELFQCTAHAPGVLLSFMNFTDALKEALPDRLAETAVLTTATLMSNRYERNQHERLSIRLGYTAEWIADVERCKPEAVTLLDDDERAVQHYVLAAVTSRGLEAAEPFEAMLARLGEAQAVAVMMLVGRYMTHAIAVNTLRLAPPVPSIFEDGFRGDAAQGAAR